MRTYKKSPIAILEEASTYEYQEGRERFLSENMRTSIEVILALVFNENITFPDYSDIKWKPNPGKVGIVDTKLDREARKLYIYTEQFTTIDINRKKAKLVQLLQALHVDEAKFLLEYVFQKRLPWRKIPKNFVEKKYPHLLENKFLF